MAKDWRCRLGFHTFEQHRDAQDRNAAYQICKRCGKFNDIPTRPPGLGLPN